MTLAKAHEFLMLDAMGAEQSKAPGQVNSFLGSVASGVFRVEGPPSKMAQSNRRLTVILAFHDASRVCLRIWIWSNHFAETSYYDRSSAATTSHYALRLRNKSRFLLEQMFAVEPLESLEVLIVQWQAVRSDTDASAAIALLHVMQGSRPKHVLPAILDALCSRTNPSALPSSRLSSQTVDLTAFNVSVFLQAYLESMEDDAVDEVWQDCVAFLRDVLANPLPYRQVMPMLLSLILLLAHKVSNTNFGEQKKMRRELADLFLRTLGAAFTTMPSGFFIEPASISGAANGETSDNFRRQQSLTLPAILARVVGELEVLLDTPDRITAAVNSISSSLLAPMFHTKSFPTNLLPEHLSLLLTMAKKSPTAKVWRKDLGEAFNDPRLFLSPFSMMRDYWLPVLHQWTLRDKERMSELLSRLTPPSSAGIMFGVGANAARLEADRRAQLNLRRIVALLLASPQDTWSSHLRDFDEKLVELFRATRSSSPSCAVKPELFMLCRALVLSLSPGNMSPLWPAINNGLQSALMSLLATDQGHQAFTNLGLLQACKLLDQLIALSPDEFQLHEWLYVSDTVDAVYQPSDVSASGLADQVAEALGTSSLEESQTLAPPVPSGEEVYTGARLLLDHGPDKSEDVKAMGRDDFARAVLRPFLSQLSIHAYEGVYGSERMDDDACRASVLQDVLDVRTIAE